MTSSTSSLGTPINSTLMRSDSFLVHVSGTPTPYYLCRVFLDLISFGPVSPSIILFSQSPCPPNWLPLPSNVVSNGCLFLTSGLIFVILFLLSLIYDNNVWRSMVFINTRIEESDLEFRKLTQWIRICRN